MLRLRRGNLLADATTPDGKERFDMLAQSPGIRIERNVSTGQVSAPGFWYDQPEDELVVLLSGVAEVGFTDGTKVRLLPGDWLDIPARERHRVTSTQADPPTVWLVVHRRSIRR